MFAFARLFHPHPAGSQPRQLSLLGAGLLGLAAVSGCSSVSLQPGAEGQAGMYGQPYANHAGNPAYGYPQAQAYGDGSMRAPVVESSLYSDGRMVASPAGQASAGAPAASPIGAPIGAQPGQTGTAPGAYSGVGGTSALPAGAAMGGAALSGPHLQAGTFASQTSAEGIASRIRNQAPQFAQQVSVQPRGSNWRVLIGPFASDAERAQAAHTIRNAIGSEVVNAAP